MPTSASLLTFGSGAELGPRLTGHLRSTGFDGIQNVAPCELLPTAANVVVHPSHFGHGLEILIPRIRNAVRVARVDPELVRHAQLREGHVHFFALGARNSRIAVHNV